MLDFVGIGAQKAGTTWMYKNLCHHPGIVFPAGKEVHFWNRSYQNNDDIARYRLLFNVGGKRNGEITPAYSFLPPEKIAAFKNNFPDIRIIFIARNPVARAWSHACMVLARAGMTLEEASNQWFIDHFSSAGSLSRGDYTQCLDHWYHSFSAEQLLLLKYEEIAEKPHEVITCICSHLGIDPAPLLEDNALLERKVFSGKGYKIRPVLADFLLKLYSEKNEAFYKKYGIDYRDKQ